MNFKYKGLLTVVTLAFIISFNVLVATEAETRTPSSRVTSKVTPKDVLSKINKKLDRIEKNQLKLIELTQSSILNTVGLNAETQGIIVNLIESRLKRINDFASGVLKELENRGFIIIKLPDGTYSLTTKKSLSKKSSNNDVFPMEDNIKPETKDTFVEAMLQAQN